MKAFENLCINILKKIFCEKLKLSRTNSEDRIIKLLAESLKTTPQNLKSYQSMALLTNNWFVLVLK